jgi:hypothetical protein
MRRFSSYGPINSKRHYYAPREELIQQAYTQLAGEYPDEDGRYITVWAPRQCGKTWVMQEVVEKIKTTGQYEVGIISMQSLKKEQSEKKILDILMEKLQISFGKSFPSIEKTSDIPRLFSGIYLSAVPMKKIKKAGRKPIYFTAWRWWGCAAYWALKTRPAHPLMFNAAFISLT